MCWYIEHFCCCVSLEVGSQVISIVTTLMSSVITVLYGAAAVFLTLSEPKLVFYICMAASSAVQVVLGVILCIGTFQKRTSLMWPWLVVTWTTSGALLLISVGGAIFLLVENYLTQDAYVIISAYVLFSLFQLYCSCVVNSRRRELAVEAESESARTLMRHPPAWKYA